MAKGLKAIPVGLKKLDKGRHSEKNTQHKADWFCTNVRDGSNWKSGPKKSLPWIPSCIPGNMSRE